MRVSRCGGEEMTDKSEIASAALPPATVSFTNAAQGMVNTGSGVQVGTNTGIMNFNFNGFGPEMAANLMAMFSGQLVPQKVSHALEWASLSSSSYSLFVLENEEYNNGAFCIAKSRALRDYTPSRYRKRYITFTPAAVSELTSMPCIFAKRNMHFGYTEASHPALLGRITDIRAQGETIKICFSGFQGVPQQLLNQNVGLLGMVHASLRNELDEEHWSIKGCNLIDVMARLQVDIE